VKQFSELNGGRAEEGSGRGIVALAMRYEFARFLVVGAIAALANLLSAWCYRWFLGGTSYHLEASVGLGAAVGTIISFVLNRSFTFRALEGRTWAQFIRFILVSVAYIVGSAFVARLIFQGLKLMPGVWEEQLLETAANVLTVGFMTIFNYFAIKHFAFLKPEGGNSPAQDRPGR
jgi:putative flippase GtrA